MRGSPVHSFAALVLGVLLLVPYVPLPYGEAAQMGHEHSAYGHGAFCTRDRCVCRHKHPHDTASHHHGPNEDRQEAHHHSQPDHSQPVHSQDSGSNHTSGTARHDHASPLDAPSPVVSISPCGSTPAGFVIPTLDKFIPALPELLLSASEDSPSTAVIPTFCRQLTRTEIFRPPVSPA